jgi:predicted Zn-dependent peptidase
LQADIHIGRLAVTRTSAEYYPLLIGRMILGGDRSRMFANIREKKGCLRRACRADLHREAATSLP